MSRGIILTEISEITIKDLRSKELTLVTDYLKEVVPKIGYTIDSKKRLIDAKSGQLILAEDGKEIYLDNEKELALISGSHIFVRNIADYSDYLASKALKIKEEQDSV